MFENSIIFRHSQSYLYKCTHRKYGSEIYIRASSSGVGLTERFTVEYFLPRKIFQLLMTLSLKIVLIDIVII